MNKLNIFLIFISLLGTFKCCNDKLLGNFLKVGNNAEQKGNKIPEWDSIKNSDTKLLKEALVDVKSDKVESEHEVDKLYSSVCLDVVEIRNESGVSQSTIAEYKQIYCKKISVNVGDHLIDLDLARTIMWNVADFLHERKLDMKFDSLGIKQQGTSQNDEFIKSFGDMKTRCWKKEADCSPSSKAKRNRHFMDKYEKGMTEGLAAMRRKYDQTVDNNSVDLKKQMEDEKKKKDAEEANKLKNEQDQKDKQKKDAEEAHKKAEEAKKVQLENQKKAVEAKRLADEAELTKKKAEEDARKKKEADDAAKLAQDKADQERKQAEEREKRQKEIEEEKKRKDAEEAKRKAEEAKRASEEAARKAENARKAEEEAKKQNDAKKIQEAEEKKKQADIEAKRAQEESKRKEEESKRAAEESKRAEKAKHDAEEEQKKRDVQRAQEHAKKEEESKKQQEEERKRVEEQSKKLEEAKKSAEEANKKAEESKKAAEQLKREDEAKKAELERTKAQQASTSSSSPSSSATSGDHNGNELHTSPTTEKEKEELKEFGKGEFFELISKIDQSEFNKRMLIQKSEQSLKQLYHGGRNLFLKKLGKEIKKVGDKIGDAVEDAAKAVKEAAKKLGDKFNKKTKGERKKTIEDSVNKINEMIKDVNVERKQRKQLINLKGKSDREKQNMRKALLNGVDLNFKPSEKRCEKKFGKDNCIKKGDFSFVYACNKGMAPVWVDDEADEFECRKPQNVDEMRQWEKYISTKERRVYNGKFEAFFYEILDG